MVPRRGQKPGAECLLVMATVVMVMVADDLRLTATTARPPLPRPASARRRRRRRAVRVAAGVDFRNYCCHPSKKVSTPQHSLVAARGQKQNARQKRRKLAKAERDRGAHKASNHRGRG